MTQPDTKLFKDLSTITERRQRAVRREQAELLRAGLIAAVQGLLRFIAWIAIALRRSAGTVR